MRCGPRQGLGMDKKFKKKKKRIGPTLQYITSIGTRPIPHMSMGITFLETKLQKKKIIIIIIKYTSSLIFLASTSCMKPNLEVGVFVEIKIL